MQLLYLPSAENLATSNSAFVRFLPRDVALSREPLEKLSVRNQLHGTVRELVTLADRSFVAIDIGQFLWSEIMTEAARELDIRAGQPITCLIKAAAIEILQ
jgi:molybdopterin-binding protein